MKHSICILSIASIAVLVSGFAFRSLAVGHATGTESLQNPEKIVETLLPDGVADHKLLPRFRRAVAVNALRQEQVKATGRRATGIAFLLAYLNYEYPTNRKRVVDALQGCIQRSVKIDCDNENTAAYMIELFERGDTGLLRPLIDAGPTSDGALTAMLGPFYGEVFQKHPVLMLQTLAKLSKKDQQRIGFLSATGDGSGLGSNKMIRGIKMNLGRYAKETDNPLSPIARTCLLGFEAGLKAVKR